VATISNIISTIFTSSGASDVSNDADRAGRSITRLGQASAGAGRQFASQSQGLGGLVAAYAGAAATSFALQAAFTALANSARSLQTIQGLTSLAAVSGEDGQKILASTQAITKGQLSLVESAQQVNLALSAGFNTSQIEGLSEVALKASRALGRDLGDAYTRVVRGSAKMETELLDELGIYTKIEPATRAYAAAIGKSVTQLTEYERRQAFVNAVVAEGQRKFASINTTIPTAAEKIEAFGKRIIDLGTIVGAFIAERLAPLADFFTNNLGASIGAFGLLGGLVLGRALTEASNKITSFQTSVEARAQAVNQRILRLTRASTERITAAQTSVAGISLAPKGTTGIRNELKDLKEIAAQRALTTQELAKAQTVLQKRISNLNTLRTAEIQQIVAARQARAAAVQGTAAYATAQQTLAGLSNRLKTTNTLLAATTAQFNTVTVAANTSNAAAARFFSTVVLRAGTAVAAVARLGVAMIGLGGFILSAVSIIGIFGSAIANALGKGDEFNAFVKGLGDTLKETFDPQIAKDTRNVFQGLSAGALTNVEAVNRELRELDTFKFRQKKFLGIEINIEKTKEDLVKEISSLLSTISLDDGLSTSEIVTTGTFWGSTLAGAFSGALVGGFAGLPGALIGAVAGGTTAALATIWAKAGDAAVNPTEQSVNKIKAIYSKELADLAVTGGVESANLAEKALAALEDQYGAAARLDPVAKAYLNTARQLVLESAKQEKNVTEIAALIAATGKSADQLVKNFKFDDSLNKVFSEISSTVLDAPVSLKIINADALTPLLSTVIEVTPNINIEEGVQTIETELFNLELAGKLTASNLQILRESLDNLSIDPSVLTYFDQFIAKGDSAINFFRKSGELLGSIGVDITSIPIGQTFAEAITAGESLNATLIRSTDLFATISAGVRAGSLDLEQFSQGIGSIASALDTAERAIPELQQEITEAAGNLARARREGADVSTYEAILGLLIRQRDAIKDTIAVEKEKLEILSQQEDLLKTQIQLNNFLKDITPKEKNVFGLELDMLKAGANSAGEELAITIDYLRVLSSETANAGAAYEAYKSIVDSTDFSANIKAAINSANLGNAADAVAGLNKIVGVTAKLLANGQLEVKDAVTGTTEAFKLQTQAQYDAGIMNERVNESIVANAQQALELAVSSMRDLSNEYSSLVKDIDAQLLNLAAEERVATIKFEADLSSIYANIDTILQEAIIEQLELDIDLTNAKVSAGALSEVEGAKEENRLRQELLKEQEYLILLQFGNELMALDARRTLLEVENAQRLDAIANEANLQREKIANDVQNITALARVYQENTSKTQSVNQSFITGFTTAGNNFNTTLAGVFTQGSQAIALAIASQGLQAGSVTAINNSAVQLTAVEDTFSNLITGFGADAASATAKITEREKALTEAQNRRYADSEKLIEAEQEAIVANYEARLAALAKEGDIEGYNALAREKKAAEAGKKDKELDYLKEKLKELFDSIKGNIQNALMSLNDLIFYREEGVNFNDKLKEIMGGMFKSIQQDFFKTTIADPLSGFLTDSVFSMFGVSGMRTGIENAKVENGALLVKVISGPADMLGIDLTKAPGAKDSIKGGKAGADSLAEGTKGIFGGFFDQITSLFSSIFGQNGFMSKLFSGLMGEGGILSGLFKGVGGFFSSLLGFSQGGLVHLAAGGAAASASLNRDRVPAMLEPGEFVIRKQSAERIGMPALQAMNATGGAGAGGGNVFVNVSNEGSPKQADASAPRFDGEKYVVDIVMRDIANNGPIRRTLRGRGGL
jgi:hypothetical protein